jgi:hypothetical protein
MRITGLFCMEDISAKQENLYAINVDYQASANII